MGKQQSKLKKKEVDELKRETKFTADELQDLFKGIVPEMSSIALKVHTCLNKPAPYSRRFVYLCMIFLWTPDVKWF